MKKLILLRHAKSDWSIPGQKDFDRTLNTRGLRVAPKMGNKFVEMETHLDAIISSPAERAKLTAQLVSEQLNFETEQVELDDEIYEASIRTLLQVVNNLDDEYTSVMLVGHNPSFTYLAEYLTNDEIGDMPTCSAVAINFPTNSWMEVSQGLGEKQWFIYPKMFDF